MAQLDQMFVKCLVANCPVERASRGYCAVYFYIKLFLNYIFTFKCNLNARLIK